MIKIKPFLKMIEIQNIFCMNIFIDFALFCPSHLHTVKVQ